MRPFIFLLLLLTGGPALLAQQSLFHKAVRLDSLYDAVDDGNEAAADAFFAELQTIYNGNSLVDRATIRADFEDNEFLSRKVSIVYGAASSRAESQGAIIDALYAERDSLLRTAGTLAQDYCASIGGGCKAGNLIRQLVLNPTLPNLTALREGVAIEKLKKILADFEVQVYVVDRALEREESIVETILQLNAATGDGISFGGSQTQSLNTSPLILQPAGPTSLQASVIDGAAKWIAERMREELSIAFFDRFGEWVSEKSIRLLFPKTFNSISNSMTTDYSLMLPILQRAFDDDLANLPFTTADFLRAELAADASVQAYNQDLLQVYQTLDSLQLIEDSLRTEQLRRKDNLARLKADQRAGREVDMSALDDAESDFFLADLDFEIMVNFDREDAEQRLEELHRQQRKNGEVLRYALFTVEALEQLSKGDHPANILEHLSREADTFFPYDSPVRPALTIASVFSKSLLSADPKRGTAWVSSEELGRLREDKGLRDIFFGLVWQEIEQSLRRQETALLQQQARLANTLLGETVTNDIAGINYDRRELLSTMLYSLGSTILRADSSLYSIITDEWFEEALHVEGEDDPSVNRHYARGMSRVFQDFFASSQEVVRRHPEFSLQRYYELYDEYEVRTKTATSETMELVTKYLLSYDQEETTETVEFILDLEPTDAEEVEALPESAYRALIDFRMTDIQGFWLEEDDFYEELRVVLAPAIEASIAKRLYLDAILTDVETERTRLLRDYSQNFIRQDSIDYVRRQWNKVPELREYNLRIRQLDDQRAFIQDRLLGGSGGMAQTLSHFVQITDRIDLIGSELKELQRLDQDNLKSAQFIYLLRSSLGIVEEVFQLALPEDAEMLREVSGLVDNVFDAYAGVLEKDYQSTLLNIVPLANDLIRRNYRERIFIEELNGRDTEQLKKEMARQELRLREVFRYGAFLATVAEAENSDAIKEAISSIALPAGSYSIKRRALTNISLQAYPGVTGGGELARMNDVGTWAPNVGFTAPIGLSYSWGYRKKLDPIRYQDDLRYKKKVDRSIRLSGDRFLNGSSGSLFLPLVDLGAVVLFRLDGSTEPLPEDVGFQQIFSPGVVYTHGFARIPLSVMMGAQVSPRLRKFGDERANAFRFNLGLTVDLPMINFFTKRQEE